MKKIFTLIVATIVAMPLFSQQFKFAYLSDTHIAEQDAVFYHGISGLFS